ncbi:MAG: DUF502 domain-containing protein [Rhodomicrobium sp.]
MVNWISRFWRTSVIGSFLAGLLFLMPIVLTVVIVAWIVNLVRGAIGPGTVLGDLLTRGGNYLLGLPNQDTLAFWLGIGIALIGIWFLGLIVKTRAKHIIQDYLDRLLTRVPLIRSIYSPVSRVVRLATDRGTGAPGDLSSMSVVSCRFGGAANGVDVLALLASQHVYNIAGERRRLVYLPTAPIPMSGGLVLVPEAAVTAVPEMKVDDLLKIYVSLGALTPEVLPGAIATTPASQSSPDKGSPAFTEPPLANAEPA